MPKKVLVAEGDSWFALPDKEVFGIGLKQTDVIDELEKLEDNKNKKFYKVKLLANHGDKLSCLGGKDQFYEFAETLLKLKKPPHAILLSGGGNDIPKNLCEMLNDNGSPAQNSNSLNENEAEKVIAGLRLEYLKLLSKINHLCAALSNKKKIPVLVHGYAYAVPDGRPFRLNIGSYTVEKTGPWLQPTFKAKGYNDLKKNTKTMEKLIDQFNCMILNLDPHNKRFSHIYVQHVDVRQRWKNKLDLQNDNNYRKYWADEFHPTKKGFKIIAKKFHCVIQNLSTIPVQDNQNA